MSYLLYTKTRSSVLKVSWKGAKLYNAAVQNSLNIHASTPKIKLYMVFQAWDSTINNCDWLLPLRFVKATTCPKPFFTRKQLVMFPANLTLALLFSEKLFKQAKIVIPTSKMSNTYVTSSLCTRSLAFPSSTNARILFFVYSFIFSLITEIRSQQLLTFPEQHLFLCL